MAGALQTVAERTREGSRALGKALARATREPERLGYLLAAGLSSGAPLAGAVRLKKLSKPTLLPLLAGGVLRSPAPAGEKTVALVGLAGGWVGDVVLLRPGAIPQGAVGFGINHLAYLRLLWQRGARPSVARVLTRALPLAAAVGLVARRQPGLLPVAVGYGGLLAAVSVLGDDPHLRESGTPELGLGHGGNLFLISDALLISRELLLREGSWAAKVAEAGVMGTYTTAQLLLVDGLFPATSAKG